MESNICHQATSPRMEGYLVKTILESLLHSPLFLHYTLMLRTRILSNLVLGFGQSSVLEFHVVLNLKRVNWFPLGLHAKPLFLVVLPVSIFHWYYSIFQLRIYQKLFFCNNILLPSMMLHNVALIVNYIDLQK